MRRANYRGRKAAGWRHRQAAGESLDAGTRIAIVSASSRVTVTVLASVSMLEGLDLTADVL